MASRSTSVRSARRPTAKKTPSKRTAKAAPKRMTKRKAPARPTMATVSAQVAALSEQVEALAQLVRSSVQRTMAVAPNAAEAAEAGEVRHTDRRARQNGSVASVEPAAFESELLRTLAQLDRRGRHAGMIPIPDVRRAFLDRGWTRGMFDDRLLQAERDFVVDLKTANDPARLAEPELAIQEPGRGYLQYVVVR